MKRQLGFRYVADQICKESQGPYLSKYLLYACELLKDGYRVWVHEPRKSSSKYVHVYRGRCRFIVRFSDHPPVRFSQDNPVDFYCGVGPGDKKTNWREALNETYEYFKGRPTG